MTTLDEAVTSAAVHVARDLAEQDARSPRDAALASLGPNAAEERIAEWISRHRPEANHAQTG